MSDLVIEMDELAIAHPTWDWNRIWQKAIENMGKERS